MARSRSTIFVFQKPAGPCAVLLGQRDSAGARGSTAQALGAPPPRTSTADIHGRAAALSAEEDRDRPNFERPTASSQRKGVVRRESGGSLRGSLGSSVSSSDPGGGQGGSSAGSAGDAVHTATFNRAAPPRTGANRLMRGMALSRGPSFTPGTQSGMEGLFGGTAPGGLPLGLGGNLKTNIMKNGLADYARGRSRSPETFGFGFTTTTALMRPRTDFGTFAPQPRDGAGPPAPAASRGGGSAGNPAASAALASDSSRILSNKSSPVSTVSNPMMNRGGAPDFRQGGSSSGPDSRASGTPSSTALDGGAGANVGQSPSSSTPQQNQLFQKTNSRRGSYGATNTRTSVSNGSSGQQFRALLGAPAGGSSVSGSSAANHMVAAGGAAGQAGLIPAYGRAWAAGAGAPPCQPPAIAPNAEGTRPSDSKTRFSVLSSAPASRQESSDSSGSGDGAAKSDGDVPKPIRSASDVPPQAPRVGRTSDSKQHGKSFSGEGASASRNTVPSAASAARLDAIPPLAGAVGAQQASHLLPVPGTATGKTVAGGTHQQQPCQEQFQVRGAGPQQSPQPTAHSLSPTKLGAGLRFGGGGFAPTGFSPIKFAGLPQFSARGERGSPPQNVQPPMGAMFRNQSEQVPEDRRAHARGGHHVQQQPPESSFFSGAMQRGPSPASALFMNRPITLTVGTSAHRGPSPLGNFGSVSRGPVVGM